MAGQLHEKHSIDMRQSKNKWKLVKERIRECVKLGILHPEKPRSR
jgi:hypothetical protein